MTENVSLITYFYENGYFALSALSKFYSTFFINLFAEQKFTNGLGSLQMEVSDAPTEAFIRHMQLEGLEEVVEIVIQSPSCKSKNTA